MALAVPLSRFTPRVGGGSAFYVRQQAHAMKLELLIRFLLAALLVLGVVSFIRSGMKKWGEKRRLMSLVTYLVAVAVGVCAFQKGMGLSPITFVDRLLIVLAVVIIPFEVYKAARRH